MILTYEKDARAFRLTHDGRIKLFTTDLKAAVKYKQYADPKAQKIFDRILVKRYELPKLPPLSFLDLHQREGVKWILTRSRSYIAHAPGAGKTATAIIACALIYEDDPPRSLFIVPPTLTTNWLREMKKFVDLYSREEHGKPHTKMPAVIVPRTDEKDQMNWDAPAIICPDSMLTKPWVLEQLQKINFKFVAVDEASRFKDAYAQRSIALYGGRTPRFTSRGLIQRATHTVFLDGSPMPNRPMELWAPTFALSPESINFMSESDFGFRYCGATQNEEGKWEFKGSTNEDELRGRLQKSFMHVVPESALKHAERLRSILYVDRDIRSKDERKFEKKVIRLLKTKLLDEARSVGDIAKARRTLGESKVKWVAKYVGERLERKNESILLFAWHRGVCEALQDALRKFRPSVIMGGTPPQDREEAIKAFNNRKTKLLIGNIASLGRGHNIQRADRIVFAEYSFTDELNKQCEKRASRRGRESTLPVRCEYVCVEGSMDEPILNTVLKKEDRVKKVIG